MEKQKTDLEILQDAIKVKDNVIDLNVERISTLYKIIEGKDKTIAHCNKILEIDNKLIENYKEQVQLYKKQYKLNVKHFVVAYFLGIASVVIIAFIVDIITKTLF
jgi:hypothetical protein